MKFDSRPIWYTQMCGHGRCGLSLDTARDRLWFGYVGCVDLLWSCTTLCVRGRALCRVGEAYLLRRKLVPIRMLLEREGAVSSKLVSELVV